MATYNTSEFKGGLKVMLDGDPCSIVERAVQRLEEQKRKRGSSYHANFILLDDDRLGQSVDRDAHLRVTATAAGIQLEHCVIRLTHTLSF